MNDEQMRSLLDAWFRDTDPMPPEPTPTAIRLMARAPQIRQRARLPAFPPFQRKARPPTASDTAVYQPCPLPATNGHAPIVIGRRQTMLSPVKAIIAGALVFALGGVILVAQPFEPRPGAAPAAEMTELQGVTVTAHQECVNSTFYSPCTVTASDPRLTGAFTTEPTGDISDERPGEGLRSGFTWLDHTLEGPEGSWSGRSYLVWTEPFQHFIILSGSGAYEGWHYLAMAT